MDHLDETTVALFVERRLDRGAADRVERHIDGCAACRALIAELGRGAETSRERADLALGTQDLTTEPAGDAGDDADVAVGARVGRYVVVGTLGKGAMGVVYAALDPDLDRKVAVKVLRRGTAASAGARARLLREAQALAKVSHPAVIAVHDVGTHAGRTFLAMELFGTGTLRTWLAARTRTWREVIEAMAQVGRGLAAAHASGLIHRDVKADNILVDDDGVARVGDFGLALAVAAAPRASGPVIALGSSTGRVLEPPLTATGAVVGTPAYMAPEQLSGAAVTAASDQFSFCVTLFEALHGTRPFPGASVDAIAAAMRTGRPVLPPDARRGVPAHVDRALRRGLAIDPARRFADMATLVRALTDDPAARRRPRMILLAVSVVAIAMTAGIVQRASAPAARCGGFAGRLEGVWDPAHRQAVATAFGATDRPYAARAAAETAKVLDAYAGTWVAMRTDACEATHVRGEQSERVLDLRMWCLDRRRAELAGLVTALAAADRDAVTRSVDAALALEPVAVCGDAVELDARPAPPTDPAQRAALTRLTDDLATARSLHSVGRYRDSQALAATVVAAAKASGRRDLEAEALLLDGQITLKLGDAAAADELLRDAAWAAEAGRRDDVAARARIAHVATGVALATFDAAHERLRAADAAIERAGSPAALLMDLANQEAILGAAEGAYEVARDRFTRALELAIALYPGDDNLVVARVLNNLGNAYYSLGAYPEARQRQERALAIRRNVLGDDHPDVGATRINLGHTLSLEGRSVDAVAQYEAGLLVLQATLGRDHPRVAMTLSDIGLELETQGRFRDALEIDRRAVEILARRDRSPELGYAHNNLAGVLESLGRHDDALAEHRIALEIREEVLGADHPDVAQTLTNMALTLVALGKHRDALTALDRALAIKTTALGKDHVRLAPTLIAIGQARLELRKPAGALAPLERARALLVATPGDPLDLAACEVLLARALRATGATPRARQLAAAAATVYTAAGKMDEAAEATALTR